MPKKTSPLICLKDLPNPFLVKVTPGASQDKVVTENDSSTDITFKVYVRAIAEDGKANRAVCIVLADFLKIPQSRLEIISGETSRMKRIAWRL